MHLKLGEDKLDDIRKEQERAATMVSKMLNESQTVQRTKGPSLMGNRWVKVNDAELTGEREKHSVETLVNWKYINWLKTVSMINYVLALWK